MEPTSQGIIDTTQLLHEHLPGAKILVVALLPRATHRKGINQLLPGFYSLPSRLSSNIKQKKTEARKPNR